MDLRVVVYKFNSGQIQKISGETPEVNSDKVRRRKKQQQFPILTTDGLQCSSEIALKKGYFATDSNLKPESAEYTFHILFWN